MRGGERGSVGRAHGDQHGEGAWGGGGGGSIGRAYNG